MGSDTIDGGQVASSAQRYSLVAIILHWVIAGFLLSNLYVGWTMNGLDALGKFNAYQLHKSIGITILLLSLCRLGWRLLHRPPPLPPATRRWEGMVAHIVHWTLYAAMIGLPLTGWLIVSASAWNIPTLLWHTVPWPDLPLAHGLLPETRKSIEDITGVVHMSLAYGTAALVSLHVAAALKHQLVSRDAVLARMIPRFGSRSVENP